MTDKVEQGDYSGWDFFRSMMGSSMQHDKQVMISTPVGGSRINATKCIADEHGTSHAEFICRAIGHELIASN